MLGIRERKYKKFLCESHKKVWKLRGRKKSTAQLGLKEVK
jgi:hypothetical protein